MDKPRSIQDILLTPPLLQDAVKDAIPVRIKTGPEPGDGTWHSFHDFLYSYGWLKTDSEGKETRIWFVDVDEFLPELYEYLWQKLMRDWRYGWHKIEPDGPVHTTEELDAVFERLQPFLEEWRQKRIEWEKTHPQADIAQFTKITIPLVKKQFPKLMS